ncbi:MAG: hypothetical protein AB1Z98_12280, partial [Nannocystaceae bacterium]
LAYDRNGQLVAAVEAKRRLGVTPEWAASLRATIVEHGELVGVPFFIVVVPEAIYMWSGEAPTDALPAVTLDARTTLAPYYERIGVDAAQIHPMAFETLVWWWLDDLTKGARRGRAPELAGLLEALTDGYLAQQAAA